jgi:hypothetical protein
MRPMDTTRSQHALGRFHEEAGPENWRFFSKSMPLAAVLKRCETFARSQELHPGTGIGADHLASGRWGFRYNLGIQVVLQY